MKIVALTGVVLFLLALAALRTKRTRTVAVVWSLIIVALCSIPGNSIPPLEILTFDKVGHFGMFFLGALIWMRAWPGEMRRVLAAGLAFAALTEVYQGAIPLLGRFADVYDFLANALGLITGLTLWWWWKQRIEPDRVPVEA